MPSQAAAAPISPASLSPLSALPVRQQQRGRGKRAVVTDNEVTTCGCAVVVPLSHCGHLLGAEDGEWGRGCPRVAGSCFARGPQQCSPRPSPPCCCALVIPPLQNVRRPCLRSEEGREPRATMDCWHCLRYSRRKAGRLGYAAFSTAPGCLVSTGGV